MKGKRRPAGAIFVCLILGTLSGCLFDRPIKSPKGKSADQLYKDGVSSLNSKNYRQAIEEFYRLKYDFPAEAAAMMADIKIADAYYANKQYQEAIESYEDFRKMHPASPYIPYVVYMLGLCHYKMVLSVDRDQTNTERSLNEFQYLLTHFPNTPYAWDAHEKTQECMKRLADHELYVGDFYYRMKKYSAAIQRYEAVLSRFPSVPLEDETLYRLAEAYRHNQQPARAHKTWRILIEQYPKSKYAKKARSRLQKFPLQTQQPTTMLESSPIRAESQSISATTSSDSLQGSAPASPPPESQTTPLVPEASTSPSRAGTADIQEKELDEAQSKEASAPAPAQPESQLEAMAEAPKLEKVEVDPLKQDGTAVVAGPPEPSESTDIQEANPGDARSTEANAPTPEQPQSQFVAMADAPELEKVNVDPLEQDASPVVPGQAEPFGNPDTQEARPGDAKSTKEPASGSTPSETGVETVDKVTTPKDAKAASLAQAKPLAALTSPPSSGTADIQEKQPDEPQSTEANAPTPAQPQSQFVAMADAPELEKVNVDPLEQDASPVVPGQAEPFGNPDTQEVRLGDAKSTKELASGSIPSETGVETVDKVTTPKDAKAASLAQAKPLAAEAPSPSSPSAETSPIQESPEAEGASALRPQTSQDTASADKGLDETLGFAELRGDLPINITADRMDAFQKENRVVFEGNVVVSQEDTYIHAQHITAKLAAKVEGGGIRRVVAIRDVRISKNEQVATCERAEFDHITRTIELSGNPKIWRGKDRIDGEKVFVNLDQEKMTVVGSDDKRVSAVIYPTSSTGSGKRPKGTTGSRPSLTAPFAPPEVAPSPAVETLPPMAKAEPVSESPPILSDHEGALPTDPEGPTHAPSGDKPERSAESERSLTPSFAQAEDEAAQIASAALRHAKPAATSSLASPSAPRWEEMHSSDSTGSPETRKSVESFIERWRTAWQSKDLEQYMACYSKRFRSGRRDWHAWRTYKSKLTRRASFIEIALEAIQIAPDNEGIEVSFVQRYRSDRHQDIGEKVLDLVKEDGRWKILREAWSAL